MFVLIFVLNNNLYVSMDALESCEHGKRRTYRSRAKLKFNKASQTVFFPDRCFRTEKSIWSEVHILIKTHH